MSVASASLAGGLEDMAAIVVIAFFTLTPFVIGRERPGQYAFVLLHVK
jgi:hypothetical protein